LLNRIYAEKQNDVSIADTADEMQIAIPNCILTRSLCWLELGT
jgi:hypothetical protein